jgi:hypothetical protein
VIYIFKHIRVAKYKGNERRGGKELKRVVAHIAAYKKPLLDSKRNNGSENCTTATAAIAGAVVVVDVAAGSVAVVAGVVVVALSLSLSLPLGLGFRVYILGFMVWVLGFGDGVGVGVFQHAPRLSNTHLKSPKDQYATKIYFKSHFKIVGVKNKSKQSENKRKQKAIRANCGLQFDF